MDYQYFIEYYKEFPFLIKLVWVVSLVMISIIIVLTIYLKIVRAFLRKKKIETEKLKISYETLLVEYLYAGEGDDNLISEPQKNIIEKLKKDVLVASKRKIIISILDNLMNEISGEMSESIKILYCKTGLMDYAMLKLKNKNWYVIAKGITELTRFKIEKSHHEISKFIKHPRVEVRKETQLYLVNMFKFEGLSFLNNLTTPLSEWQQVQLLEVLNKFEDQQICDIKPWLKSNNDTVVLFALKLAQIYNQFEVKDALMDLLPHENKNIRIRTIEVLTDLYGIEAKDRLKANFNGLSLEEQISFFEFLEKLVVPSDEPFVEKHLFHKDFEIQLLALKILKSINIDKYMGLQDLPTHKKTPAMLKLVNAV